MLQFINYPIQVHHFIIIILLLFRYSRYEKNRMAKLSQGDAGETHSLVDLGPDDDVKTETLVNDFKKLSKKLVITFSFSACIRKQC